jgi:tetratricopeptide (TPR) repeat protein
MKKKLLAFNLIFLTIPAILLSLLTAEVALRVSGYAHSIVRNTYSSEANLSKHSTRILCLGDSFTWGLGALPEKSYPAQLKELFAENCNKPIEVYNAGVPGFNSSLVLKELNKNIKKYNPNFIVIMIGSNNTWNLEESSYFLLKEMDSKHLNYLESILIKLKIYKLAKICLLAIRNKEMPPIEKNNSVSINPNSIAALGTGSLLFDEGKYELAAEYFDKALLLDSHNYLACMRRAIMLAVEKKYNLAKEALNRAASLINYYTIQDFHLYFNIMMSVLINSNERIDMIRKLKLLIKECLSDSQRRKKFLQILAAKEELLIDSTLGQKILMYDLERIVFLAQQRNIQVILQTYPTGSFDTAIKRISRKYALALVDNHLIFKEKRKYMTFEDLFVSVYDRHCNARGYRLIAENIYNVFMRNNYLADCKKID